MSDDLNELSSGEGSEPETSSVSVAENTEVLSECPTVENSTTTASGTNLCNQPCCAGSEISQPTSTIVLKKTEKLYGSGVNARKRVFLASWYKQFSWIHLCCSRQKVYCYYCQHAYNSQVRVVSSKADPAFTTVGFSNWKKALDRFKEHESSLAHRDCLAAFIASKSTSVDELLLKGLDKDQSKRRCSLLKQLAALRFLMRQGLPVRNDHTGGSNLTVLLETVLDEKSWVHEKKYQSPEIINEMIEIMAHDVLRSLLSDIKSRRWFSLMADETRDVSNREQLVLCLRWVSDNYEVHEDQVGLAQLDNTTAKLIYESLKVCLLSLGIPFEKCRGQAYDGARNFQGHVSGVAKRFKNDNDAAISVHCLAHCVNLCLQEVARSSKPVKEALNFAMDLIQLIKLSPKRQVTLEAVQIQQDSSSTTSGIRSLCPTRWTVRTGAMEAIIRNYEALQETMEISSHGTDDCSRRANGMIALMDRFSTYFGLKFSTLLFSITEQMSIHLQGKDTKVQDGYMLVNQSIKALKRLRTDNSFDTFFESVKKEASGLCDPPVLPRQRQLPRRIDDGASQHVHVSIEDYYRREYYQAIDTVIGELESRFIQESFLLVRKIETILLDSANGKAVSLPQEICSLYQKDIDFPKLKLHLQMLPDAIKAKPFDGIHIREVTKIQTICDVLNDQPSVKSLLTEIHKLLLIYLTIPVTTATAERSFSALKRVKTYLRNSMTQQRLNHAMLMHIHHQKTDELNLSKIAQEFIERNERRRNFFGHYQ